MEPTLSQLFDSMNQQKEQLDTILELFHQTFGTNPLLDVTEMNQAEAARYLGTNSQKMIRLRRNGQLHPHLVGGTWMYRRRELDMYTRRHSL